MAKIQNKTSLPRQARKKESAKFHITPIQLPRIVQDTMGRREAMAEAERAYFPYRHKMQQLFLNTWDNGHVSACVERRKDLTLLRKWYFGETDNPDDVVTELFNTQWFRLFLNHAMDALFFGYSLIELGDIIDTQFPDIKVVKRWNVSPDRYEIMQFPYMPHGVNFLEDPEISDWYVYVDTPNEFGVSPCGYGLLWNISIYEIFLRNLLGYNGTFVELFAQPIRWGKTNHIEGPERDLLEQALRDMGSAGYLITDPTDEVVLLDSALSGTGYKSYDNLETRLQKVISKVILGHEDAITSTPGKLGSQQGADSPAGKAMIDKQTKDGEFITNVVNAILVPALRKLGFNIPDNCNFIFKNDGEVMDNANNITDLAVKIKNAGLQMDEAYYTEQTGIPVKMIAKQAPAPFDKNVQNRLNLLYK